MFILKTAVTYKEFGANFRGVGAGHIFTQRLSKWSEKSV